MDKKVSKYQNFHCYLLLAAENFLLAEQFEITASSSASKLPACANTRNHKSWKIIVWHSTTLYNIVLQVDMKFYVNMNESFQEGV